MFSAIRNSNEGSSVRLTAAIKGLVFLENLRQAEEDSLKAELASLPADHFRRGELTKRRMGTLQQLIECRLLQTEQDYALTIMNATDPHRAAGIARAHGRDAHGLARGLDAHGLDKLCNTIDPYYEELARAKLLEARNESPSAMLHPPPSDPKTPIGAALQPQAEPSQTLAGTSSLWSLRPHLPPSN